MPTKTMFLFDFIFSFIEKTQICLILKLLTVKYMQFTRKTSGSGSGNSIRLIIKLCSIIVVLFIIVILIGKIDFPTPNKKIEKILPNENFKKIK
tara:strand:+ start:428 stop:709 length:282 start_codon:yes stop_codon:yes gene_type:complete